MKQTLFLFGEAEKGQYCLPIPCHSLLELSEIFGNPPENTQGLFYAVQALLYERSLIYFRVKEEGFELSDYKRGLKMLRKKEMHKEPLAICLPGMGDPRILEEASEICYIYHCIFIITEKDLYDYITN